MNHGLAGLALFISGIFLGIAIQDIKAEPECPQPSCFLRQDCSIKISKTLKDFSNECKQTKGKK